MLRARPASSLVILASAILLSLPLTLSAAVAGSAPDSCGALSTTDLAEHMSQEIDTRLAGIDTGAPTSTVLPVFSTRGAGAGSTWVRNLNHWSKRLADDIDWTGASPWNSSGGYHYAGTLISPRHFAMASHYPVPVGATMAFVTEDNQVVERTVTAYSTVYSDMTIGILDSAVPETISFYAIASSSRLTSRIQLPASPEIPMVNFNQYDEAVIERVTQIFGGPGQPSSLGHNVSTTAFPLRRYLTKNMLGGDSGNPGFLVIDGAPILAITHAGSYFGPNYAASLPQIDATMDTLSGFDEYDPVEYDLSCFDTLGVNETPVWVGNVSADGEILEAEAPPSPFRTVLATDIDGDTLTYSLAGLAAYDDGELVTRILDVEDYFSINPSSGAISVNPAADFNFEELGDGLLLEVSASDGATPAPAIIGAQIRILLIDQEDAPEFSSGGYAFSVGYGASAGASVGTVLAEDEDVGETVTYSILSGNESSAFAVGESSGAITVASSEALATLAGQAATLEVRATSTTVSGKRASSVDNFSTTTVSVSVGAAPVAESPSRRGGGGGGGSSSRRTVSQKVVATPLAPTAPTQPVAPVVAGSFPVAALAASAVPSVDLEQGATGPSVSQLQARMIALAAGPNARALAAVGATGYFGPLTRATVIEFQQARGIVPAVGYFGPKTRAALAI